MLLLFEKAKQTWRLAMKLLGDPKCKRGIRITQVADHLTGIHLSPTGRRIRPHFLQPLRQFGV